MYSEPQSPMSGAIDLANEKRLNTETNSLYEKLNVSSRVFRTVKKRYFATSPIGLFAFAFSCFTTGLGNMGIITYSHLTLSAYIVFGGIIQYIMGISEWIKGNSLNTLISILFSCYNTSCFFWDFLSDQKYTPKYSGNTFGYFNLIWLPMMIAATVGVWKGSKVEFADYVLVNFVFLFNMLSGFTELKVFKMMSGITYFIISIVTFYLGFAIIINSTYKNTFLPLFAPGEKLTCIKK